MNRRRHTSSKDEPVVLLAVVVVVLETRSGNPRVKALNNTIQNYRRKRPSEAKERCEIATWLHASRDATAWEW
jgi:hypothetical protein